MSDKIKTYDVYVDERHNPTRVGYVAFSSRQSLLRLQDKLNRYKKERGLRFHAREDLHDRYTKAAFFEVAAYLQNYVISNSQTLKYGSICSRTPYLDLCLYLQSIEGVRSIETDELSMHAQERQAVDSIIKKNKWQFRSLPKHVQSPLVGVVDYLLYIGFI